MKKKYKIGYTCGVFDLLHVGHLNLLERCKAMCKYLIVGVCDDDYVRNYKHKEPVIPLAERIRILEALKCVDQASAVSISETNDKMLALKKFHFNVLFSGDDWKGSERYIKTEEEFAKLGVAIEYFPYTNGISSSDIKQKLKNESRINNIKKVIKDIDMSDLGANGGGGNIKPLSAGAAA